MNCFTPKNRRLLSLWPLLLTTACAAKIEASGSSNQKAVNIARPKLDPIVRVFDVRSPEGLNVDAATSGLGLNIAMPQDVSTTPEFKLTITLAPSDGVDPFTLTLSSELESLERPTSLGIPRSLLPDAVLAGASALVVKDPARIRRVFAQESIKWTEREAIVTTSQPMGEWTFAAEDAQAESNYLVIATSGLTPDESLRYEVEFFEQKRFDRTYEIQLPNDVLKQKIIGNETRYLSAPQKTSGSYGITVLEAPVKKVCAPVIETGALRGRVEALIECKGR